MIRACVCLLLGAMLPQHISFPIASDPHVPRFVAQMLVAVAAAMLLLPRLQRRDLLLLACGVSAYGLAAHGVIASRIAHDYVGDSLLTELRIVEFPRRSASATRFVAVAVDDSRISGRLSLNWFEPPVHLRLGDVWQLEVRLKRPRGNRNPGSVDREAWLLRHRIVATGYVVPGKHNELRDSGTARGLTGLRLKLVERIERTLDDPLTASVMSALLVGARHAISPQQWDLYARTGTSHLMAISGLHIGLAAGSAYLFGVALFGVGFRAGNNHDYALCLALVVAFGYALLAGFAVPARRAAVMLALAAAGARLRREPAPYRILAGTLGLVVLTDPLASMAPGFHLSFAAVLLLFWFAGRGAPRAGSRVVRWARNLGSAQLLLFMGLLPLTASIFGQVSLAAPLVNLIAVPLFSAVTVPLGLGSITLAGVLPSVADLALAGAARSIEWLHVLIDLAGRHELAATPIAGFRGVALAMLMLPLLWCLLPGGWPARNVAWVAVLAVIQWRPEPPSPGCVELHALDVGQGQALLVRTRGHVLLYDTGPAFRDGGSAAERVVLPFLRHQGITRIDRLVVSHADLDHAGGVATILQNVEVDDVMSGEPLSNIGIPQVTCTSAISWHWDDLRLSFLHPQPGQAMAGNNTSCVLLLELGRQRVLVTGDIEAAVEAALVRGRSLPRVDLVTVPHHGSRTSSTTPFVRALAPSIALVSSGHGNRWGFPKRDVVARWEQYGAMLVNTADSGAVSVRLCHDGTVAGPSGYRDRERRLWHE